MVKTLHARLVAYLPNGGRLGNLPAPLSWDASIVNNDLGASRSPTAVVPPAAES